MSDRPILFSAPMVRALLDGRKTQTRRILKPQPGPCEHKPYPSAADEFVPSIDEDGLHCAQCGNGLGIANTKSGVRGIPVRFRKGDRLWVKETWRTVARHDAVKPTELPRNGLLVTYDADHLEEPNDGCRGKTRVSIHMPRCASRLTLTVSDVRVQRLQEITPADAIAEGIRPSANSMTIDCETRDPRDDFQALWDSINGAGSWDANPWVVALTFTVERRNIDAVPMPYLIWSNVHGAWWGPDRAGYYTELSLAGRYTREEAIKQCAYGRDGFTARRTPPELPVREIDAINRGGRRIDDLALKADRAECRARDLASKAKVPA